MNSSYLGLIILFSIIVIFFGGLTVWQITGLINSNRKSIKVSKLVDRTNGNDEAKKENKSHEELIIIINSDKNSYEAAVKTEVARRLKTITDKELMSLIK